MAEPKTDSVVLAVRVPAELKARLDAQADARDLGLGVLVTRALERALGRWESQDLDTLTYPPNGGNHCGHGHSDVV